MNQCYLCKHSAESFEKIEILNPYDLTTHYFFICEECINSHKATTIRSINKLKKAASHSSCILQNLIALKDLNVDFGLYQIPNDGPNPVYEGNPFPNNIGAIKNWLGLSQLNMARKLNVSEKTIAKLDRQEIRLSDEIIGIIRKVFKVEAKRYY